MDNELMRALNNRNPRRNQMLTNRLFIVETETYTLSLETKIEQRH